MSKLKEFFSMSKQERNGAWAIAILIVILLAAVFIEKQCASGTIDSSAQKKMNEYINKTKDIEISESKNAKSKSSKKSHKAKSNDKTSKKSNDKKDKKKSKKKSTNKPTTQKSSPSRNLEPLPQI